MNLRPGVDTHPPDFFLLVRLNLPFDQRDRVIGFLQALEAVSREKLSPTRVHGVEPGKSDNPLSPQFVVRDLALNLLVGFGLRFFLGPLGQRTSEEPIPNFPPGGVFAPRNPTRFGITGRHVPLYLRTMNAAGDDVWIRKRLTTSDGKPPADDAVSAEYRRWLEQSEADLILVFEADNLFLVVDYWDAVRKAAIVPFGAQVVAIHEAFNRGDGRDHTGFNDGISNLVDRMQTDPVWYRSKIYLPHPAPAYPGEPDWNRDDPSYDGGTYLVHRKYVENLQRWRDGTFKVTDYYGQTYSDSEAREHAVGRREDSGLVISRFHDRPLDREPDSAEVNLAYNESHVLKARGGATAPFTGDFPPVKPGGTNVFNTQDIRIRRRGVNFSEIDPLTGAVTYGLHFICFQNNIQQTGFEFINNIWLMNPHFRRSTDTMFDPDNGIIFPTEGCYYFVPAEHRHYPGDIFFD